MKYQTVPIILNYFLSFFLLSLSITDGGAMSNPAESWRMRRHDFSSPFFLPSTLYGIDELNEQ